MLAILKIVGGWLIRMLLGSLASSVVRARAERAERQRDAAILRAKSTEESMNFEKALLEKLRDRDKLFDAGKKDANAPFGAKAWNAGRGLNR